MVDLTRRGTVIGLGLLATGSGATFTSAAFQSGTRRDSDLRVLVEEENRVVVEANPDLNPDDRSDLTDNGDLFPGNGNDSGNARGDVRENAPLAYVDGSTADEDFTLETAVDVGTSPTFNDIIQLRNPLDYEVEIGIAYDRSLTGDIYGSNGQYGEDIDQGDLSYEQAQRIYQFTNSDTGLISPQPGSTGQNGDQSPGTGFEIPNGEDEPNNLITLDSGNTKLLSLSIDTATDAEDIRDASDVTDGQLGFQSDTVQIIEEITVVADPAN